MKRIILIVSLLCLFAVPAFAQSDNDIPQLPQDSLFMTTDGFAPSAPVILMQAGSGLVFLPKTLQFTPSPDHGTTFSNGTAAVTRYEARAYEVSAPTVLVGTAKDLGKPAPVSGSITYDIQSWVATLPGMKELLVKVAAVGPTGEGVSAASNPFVPPGAPGAPGAVTAKQ